MIPKFRVWHRGSWVQRNILWKLLGRWEWIEKENAMAFKVNKNTIFMQSTGLKDKKGKEIFEGDIISQKKGNLEWLGFVDFVLGCFCGKIKYKFNGQWSKFEHDFGWESDCFEVIGNIHENPELLEGSE